MIFFRKWVHHDNPIYIYAVPEQHLQSTVPGLLLLFCQPSPIFILFHSLHGEALGIEQKSLYQNVFSREFFYRKTHKARKIERGKIHIRVLQYIP